MIHEEKYFEKNLLEHKNPKHRVVFKEVHTEEELTKDVGIFTVPGAEENASGKAPIGDGNSREVIDLKSIAYREAGGKVPDSVFNQVACRSAVPRTDFVLVSDGQQQRVVFQLSLLKEKIDYLVEQGHFFLVQDTEVFAEEKNEIVLISNSKGSVKIRPFLTLKPYGKGKKLLQLVTTIKIDYLKKEV